MDVCACVYYIGISEYFNQYILIPLLKVYGMCEYVRTYKYASLRIFKESVHLNCVYNIMCVCVCPRLTLLKVVRVLYVRNASVRIFSF